MRPPGGRPEDRARANIDRLLTVAGWLIQSRDSIDIEAGRAAIAVLLNQMAAMVNIELPADLTAQFESENVSEEAARLLALELFREQKVSLGRAAELCSMPLAAFMKFSAAHGVPPMTYSLDDLEADRKTIERLGL